MTGQSSPSTPSASAVNAAIRGALASLIVTGGIGLFHLYRGLTAQDPDPAHAWLAAGLNLGMALCAVIGLALARRGRPTAGAWLVIGSFYIGVLTVQMVESGLGVTLLLAALAIPLVSVLSVPASHLPAMVGLGVAAGLAGLAIDSFWPFPRPASPVAAALPLAAAGVVGFLAIGLARQFRDLSLRFKLVVAFLLVALLPLAVQGYFGFQNLSAIVTERANAELLSDANSLATEVDAFFADRLEAARTQASLVVFAEYLVMPAEGRTFSPEENRLRRSVRSLAQQDPNISSLAILDLEGRNVYDSSVSQIGVDESFTDYYQAALATKLPYAAPVQMSLSQNLPVLNFSAPIWNNQDIVGVLRVQYRLDALHGLSLAHSDLSGSQTSALIVDENGIRLVDVLRRDLVMKTISPLSAAEVIALQKANRLPARAQEDLITFLPSLSEGLAGAGSQATFAAVPAPDGEWSQVAVATMAAQPWRVMMTQPVAVFTSGLEGQTRNLLWLALLIGAVVSLAALPIAQTLAEPIARLNTAALRVAEGDFTAQAPVNSRDEIGRLGQTFNQMTTQLRDVLGGLEQRVAARTRDLNLAQQRAQAIAAQLRTASRAARLAGLEIDLHKEEVLVNDAYYDLLSTSVDAQGGYRLPIATFVKRFVHPEDGRRFQAEVWKIAQSEAVPQAGWDSHFVTADGSTLIMALTLEINRDEFGRPVVASGAIQDVTAQRRAAEELEANRSQLQALMDNIPVGVFMADAATGRPVLVNRAGAQLLGRPADPVSGAEAYGETYQLVEVGTDQPLAPEALPLPRTLLTGEVARDTLDILQPNGQRITVEAMSAPIRNARGEMVNAVALFSDVTERSRQESLLAKRAADMATVAEVGAIIGQVQNVDDLLWNVSDLVKTRFGLYHTHIYLLNEARDALVLTAGAGEIGRAMVAQGRVIPVTREQSLVARAARSREGVVVGDVRAAPDFLPHPLLPETRAEMSVPLLAGQEVLGVLDVQADRPEAFTAEDVRVLTTLGSQIAVALQNARLFAQAEAARRELEARARQLTHQQWRSFTEATGHQLAYQLEGLEVRPAAAVEPPSPTGTVEPLVVNGEAIGHLALPEVTTLDEEGRNLLDEVMGRLSAHIENLRLTAQTETALGETAQLYDISAKLGSANSLEEVAQVTRQAAAEGAIVFLFTHALNAHGQPERLRVAAALDAAGEPLTAMQGMEFQADLFSHARHWINDPENVLVVEDLDSDPRIDAPTRVLMTGVESLAILPLTVGGRWVGQLTFTWQQKRGFGANERRLYAALMRQVATTMDNILLFEQTRKRAERERMINEITQKIQNTATVPGALQTAIQELGLALKARQTRVALNIAGAAPAAPNGDAHGAHEN